MNRVFSITKSIVVPDGTIVYPFLNSKDCTSNLPWGLVNDVSLAVGDILPNTHSKIHVHPVVTLITWVVFGTLQIKMKDLTEHEPYTVTLAPEQVALTKPGTFLQHINTTSSPCRALYIVSPAYVFLMKEDGTVEYDDAIALDLEWDKLAVQKWQVPHFTDIDGIRATRERASAQIKMMKESV